MNKGEQDAQGETWHKWHSRIFDPDGVGHVSILNQDNIEVARVWLPENADLIVSAHNESASRSQALEATIARAEKAEREVAFITDAMDDTAGELGVLGKSYVTRDEWQARADTAEAALGVANAQLDEAVKALERGLQWLSACRATKSYTLSVDLGEADATYQEMTEALSRITPNQDLQEVCEEVYRDLHYHEKCVLPKGHEGRHSFAEGSQDLQEVEG